MSFQDFKTLNDPTLVMMKVIAEEFYTDAKSGNNYPPRWITFSGTTGTGKTLLSQITFDLLKNLPHLRRHSSLTNGCYKIMWPVFVGKVFNGNQYLTGWLQDANLAFIDDVSIGRDERGGERELLWRVLAPRIGKWTIITTNMTIAGIRDNADSRIASRMIRDGSIFVECNTQDYALRKKD